jgi:hypothetical protein
MAGLGFRGSRTDPAQKQDVHYPRLTSSLLLPLFSFLPMVLEYGLIGTRTPPSLYTSLCNLPSRHLPIRIPRPFPCRVRRFAGTNIPTAAQLN